MDRRASRKAFIPILIGSALLGWDAMEAAFTGFGGHSKARPITMVKGRDQRQWR